MSCLCDPNTLTVGASCAIFGLIGAMVRLRQFGWILMNWTSLGEGNHKYFTLAWLGILLVINLLFGLVSYIQASETIDNYGHMGGLLTGFCLAPAILQFLDDSKPNKFIWRLSGACAVSIYLAVGWTVFYTAVHTERLYY